MILDIFNNNFILNGEEVSNCGSGYFLKFESANTFFLEYTKPSKNEDGLFIYFDKKSYEITIQSSFFGEIPLFYFLRSNNIIISTSFPELLHNINDKKKLTVSFDRIGIIESLIFDTPLRSRTLFENIKKAMPGKRLTIKLESAMLKEETLFVLPFDKGNTVADKKKFLNNATDIIQGVTSQFKKLNNKIILPLSGGLDSRILACLLKANDIPFEAVTFGPKESTDPFIAKKIAKELEMPINHLVLKDNYYKQYGDEVTWLTGGLSSHMHCHLYAIFSSSNMSADYIIHGQYGGNYAGASQPEHSCSYTMSEHEALNDYLFKNVEPVWIWSKLSNGDQEIIIKDLTEIMQDNCHENLPCHFEEYIHNVERQFSLLSNVFSPLEIFGKIIRPFAKKDYAIFFNSLPFELRVDRNLYREACALLFPRAFQIGTEKQIYSKQSFLGKIEKKMSSFVAKVSYLTLLLSNGKLVIRNPKGFERHRELLCTNLKDDYMSAITHISDLLNIDLHRLGQNSLKNRSQIFSQYRILSLYSLIKSLKSHSIMVDRTSI